MIKPGDSVQRRDVWGHNKTQPTGPVLTVASVEDQIGQFGHTVKKDGIIRLSDGSVELPGNLIPYAQPVVSAELDALWDEPIDLGKRKTPLKKSNMGDKMLAEIRSHD